MSENSLIVRFAILSVLLTLASGASAQPACPQPPASAASLAVQAEKLAVVDLDSGIELMTKAVDAAPDRPEFLHALSVFQNKKKDWKQAIGALEQALSLRPNSGLYLQELGLALVRLAQQEPSLALWQKADAILSKCVQVDPNRSLCFHQRAIVSLHLDRERQALLDFSKAITLRPDNAPFYPHLVDLYYRLDYLEQAEAVARLGLSFASDDDNSKTELLLTLASIRQAQHDVSGMIDALAQADAADGDRTPEIKFLLGSAYALQGNKVESRQMLKQFVTQVCKGPKAIKYKDQCEQSVVLLQQQGAI